MKNKKKRKLGGFTTFDLGVTLIAILVILVTLYPMIYVLSCSFSDPRMVLAGKVKFLPVGFSLDAYKIVMGNPDFWIGMRNSIFYVIAGCILMFINTTPVAYCLTRPNLKFRKALTYFLLIPMYFGGGMIPAFLLITKLGLYNTYWSLILPGCYSIFHIILCKSFMSSLPGDLIDSAMIDGTDQIQTFLRIILPLSKPVLAVIMIYTIVGIWNSWFNASIYTTKTELQPVQLFLRQTLSQTQNSAASEFIKNLPREMQEKYQEMAMSANQIKHAMIIIITAPIIAVYPMFQKHFTKGMMLGSLKG